MQPHRTAPAVSPPTTIYRDEPATTCANVYAGETYIGQVWYFVGTISGHPERSNRWYWQASRDDLPLECLDDGYATYGDARQSLIAAWEGRS